MAVSYVAVDKNGTEWHYKEKPIKHESEGYWEDSTTYWEMRGYTTNADDGSINLPKGSIEKLTGKKASWEDEEPIQLGESNKA